MKEINQKNIEQNRKKTLFIYLNFCHTCLKFEMIYCFKRRLLIRKKYKQDNKLIPENIPSEC